MKVQKHVQDAGIWQWCEQELVHRYAITICLWTLAWHVPSYLHGVGKKIGLKLIRTNKVFFEQAQVFSKQNSTKAEVIAAEDKALLHIYKGLPGDALNFLRFQRFHQKVGSSISLVQPEVLPPSSAAAAYHSLCVYPQVQDWIGKATEMSPEDWGWYTHKVIISCWCSLIEQQLLHHCLK